MIVLLRRQTVIGVYTDAVSKVTIDEVSFRNR